MKKTIMTILKVVFLLVLFAWICLVFTDYFRARKDEKPLVCLKEETKVYDDGTVYQCTGLGYKMFKYERASITATEFGPFFIQERTSISK